VKRQHTAFVALLVGLALLLSAGLATAAEKEKPVAEPLYATLKTSLGVIVIRLFEDKAPKTVENFVGLASGTKEWTDPRTGEKVKRPLYNGTIFHRVIGDFMIQGGCPRGDGTGGPGYTFDDEASALELPVVRGALAMANAGPNTNGSQFFITLGPTPHLDNRHSVFGEIVQGQEVVVAIGNSPRGANDRPVKDVVLQEVVISRGKY
jgi:peptidyl-prolyl cis-trans isomerase A (cyclophilin A)